MIRTQDLTKQFDDFVAVDGVNVNVAAGQVLVMLGPNGAGKTTTVRMLTAILAPTRGRAWVAGYDVAQQPHQVRAAVGVLTENHGLYNRMNADEYLRFFGDLYKLNRLTCQKRIDRLLEQFDLLHGRKKRLGEYSKGMRQKLALARALLHEPPVLLLDEPTSAMDPESARMVRDALHQLRTGDRTIILCTHNLVEAEELADQIAIIRNGRILVNDTPDHIKQNVLGPAEYEATFSANINGWDMPALTGVEITQRGASWLRLRVADPHELNPLILQQLLQAQLPVVTFQKAAQSLEAAYLRVMEHYAVSNKPL